MSEIQLHLGDCLDILPTLPSESVDLVFCDPPYNIGIFCKMPEAEYLAWCERWIAEASRALAANGAFWISHKDPAVLVELSRMVADGGRKRINWITWDKYNGNPTHQCGAGGGGPMVGMTQVQALRSFQPMVEFLVYHADDGEWEHACGKLWSGEFEHRRGFIFESLRAYLEGERKRAGVNKVDINVACGFSPSPGGMASRHYFSRSQWCLPTAEHYAAMQRLFNGNNGGEYLRREYEYLRREYEDLRYTFNNPGKVSSVWQIPPAPSNGHPTPKPEQLLERIIKATSNEGDTVLDFFVGSGTTGKVAVKLGRNFIGCDNAEKWVRFTEQRIAEAQVQPRLEGLP